MANLLEPIIQDTIENIRSTFCRLCAIWEDIGFTEEARNIYCKQASDHINELLIDMVHESEQKKNILLSNVTELMEELSTLTKELGGNIQTGGYENLPLYKVEKVLRTDLDTVRYCKEQRLALLQELRAREQSLCELLDTQPFRIEEKLLSEEEFNSFKLYIETQESEKNRLEKNFKEMRREIIEMMDELEILPSTNFEHLVYKDGANFLCSSNNMAKLKKFKEELKRQMEKAKEYVEDIKKKLIDLWKNLDEPEQICHSFLNSYVGYSITTINALEAELERCKEKQNQNIGQCISQVRSELVKLWDLCKFSEAQKGEFQYFLCQTYTEDLLSLHEFEVERLQNFYAANKSVFELLEERNNLWLKMKELLQPTNSDRFYNRGGQLLMEEKERKIIQKKLPKIEERLKHLIKEYESLNGEVFTVNGMSVEELLKESWDHLNEEKETIKKTRKEAKDKSVKNGVLSSTKKIPTLLISHRRTPTNILKRKLMFTPSPNTSTKRRSLSLNNSGSKQKKSGRTPRTVVTSESQSSAATDTTYNQFKEHLEKRTEIRSSLLNVTIKRRSLSLNNSGSKQKKSRRIPRIVVTSESQSSAATDTTYNQFKEHLEERRELRSSLLNATIKRPSLSLKNSGSKQKKAEEFLEQS